MKTKTLAKRTAKLALKYRLRISDIHLELGAALQHLDQAEADAKNGADPEAELADVDRCIACASALLEDMCLPPNPKAKHPIGCICIGCNPSAPSGKSGPDPLRCK